MPVVERKGPCVSSPPAGWDPGRRCRRSPLKKKSPDCSRLSLHLSGGRPLLGDLHFIAKATKPLGVPFARPRSAGASPPVGTIAHSSREKRAAHEGSRGPARRQLSTPARWRSTGEGSHDVCLGTRRTADPTENLAEPTAPNLAPAVTSSSASRRRPRCGRSTESARPQETLAADARPDQAKTTKEAARINLPVL